MLAKTLNVKSLIINVKSSVKRSTMKSFRFISHRTRLECSRISECRDTKQPVLGPFLVCRSPPCRATIKCALISFTMFSLKTFFVLSFFTPRSCGVRSPYRVLSKCSTILNLNALDWTPYLPWPIFVKYILSYSRV